jgi:hypothetical protein
MRLGGAKSKKNAQRSMQVYALQPRKGEAGVDLIPMRCHSVGCDRL